MAIIIPSKNIYNVDNPKVRNNLVDNVNFKTKIISPQNEYEILVCSIERPYVLEELSVENYGNHSEVTAEAYSQAMMRYSAKYSSCKFYYLDFSFKLPIVKDNRYVSKIYNEENDETDAQNQKKKISWSFIGRTSTTLATATSNYNRDNPITSQLSYGETTTTDFQNMELPKIGFNSVGDDYIGISIKDNSSVNYTVNENFYLINGRILSSIEYNILRGDQIVGNLQSPVSAPINGKKVLIETKEIQISVYGDTIGISLEDATLHYGGNKHPLSLSVSEIKQKTTATLNTESSAKFKIEDFDVLFDGVVTRITPLEGNFVEGLWVKSTPISSSPWSSVLYKDAYGYLSLKTTTSIGQLNEEIECYTEEYSSKYFSEKVIDRYKNGKETAEILCGINDYFSDVGDKVISDTGETGKMTFEIGDIVIPQTLSANGVDAPLSRYENGNPKQFEVVGAKFIYDGAVWQELTLQEV